MARNKGTAGNNQEVEANSNAARVTHLAADIGVLGINGRYHFSITPTGALATLAARTASAGHITHLYNKHATKLVLIHRVQAKAVATVSATVAQQVGLQIVHTHTVTAQHNAGGAAISLATPQAKVRKSHLDASAVLDIYSANSTTEISGGTLTPKTMCLAEENEWQLAAGAAVPAARLRVDFDRRSAASGPLVLEPGEGILIANSILFANSHAAIVRSEWDLSIVDSYAQ